MSDRERAVLQRKIMKLTLAMLQTLLEFKTVYDIQAYMTDRHGRDFRTFEEETADQVFAGAGVLATRENIVVIDKFGDAEFCHWEVPMGSHETGAYIMAFPLAAASASYVFTLIEGFGDDIADLVSPGSRNRNRAWHEDVKGFADLADPVQVTKAREAFAKHFAADPADVPPLAARRIVGLKAARNAFAHDGERSIDFQQFLQDALAIVCHIAFLTTGEDRISVYPWEDHMDQFAPRSS
ncbi:hypothetical protein PX699_02535 [Sphingobium sp. H39-3-25]|uniref:hypothetical protein n=1 Tax=Sphingobium arseniciresistens TaxID=3030834 RepID=UPI0023B99AA9|nr:hypothetical protein [Sphingobium arseniciresistens]